MDERAGTKKKKGVEGGRAGVDKTGEASVAENGPTLGAGDGAGGSRARKWEGVPRRPRQGFDKAPAGLETKKSGACHWEVSKMSANGRCGPWTLGDSDSLWVQKLCTSLFAKCPKWVSNRSGEPGYKKGVREARSDGACRNLRVG